MGTVTTSLFAFLRPGALLASVAVHAATFGALAVHLSGGTANVEVRETAPAQNLVELPIEETVAPPAPAPTAEEPPAVAHQDAPVRSTVQTTGQASAAPSRAGATGKTEESAVAPVLEAPVDAPVHFTLSSSPAFATHAAFGADGPRGTEAAAPPPETTYAASAVSSPAKLVASSPAVYPPEARAAEIEADVPVEIVVDQGGSVVSASAASHAGYGLDDAAMRAVRTYRFSPATREGHAVRVRMRWVVQFRLR